MFNDILNKLTKEEITVVVAIVGVFGGAVGVGITALFGLLQALINRRSEDRRQLRQVAAQLAVEQWKYEVQRIAKLNADIQASTQIQESMKMSFSPPTVTKIAIEMIALIESASKRQSLFRRLFPRQEATPKTT